MWIKPAPGHRVRNPRTLKFILEGGMDVPDGDLLWTKLLAHKDVVKGDPPAAEPAPAPAPPALPPSSTAKTAAGVDDSAQK